MVTRTRGANVAQSGPVTARGWELAMVLAAQPNIHREH